METKNNLLYEAPKAEAFTLNCEKMICNSNTGQGSVMRSNYGEEEDF